MGLTYPVDLLTVFIDVFVHMQYFVKCIFILLIRELSSFSAVDLPHCFGGFLSIQVKSNL